jgi:hypothetical protein
VGGERAGEQQRPHAEAEAGERRTQRVDGLVAVGRIDGGSEREQDLQRVGEHERDGDRQQPPVVLQEAERVVGEAHSERAGGGEGTGQQRRQEGPQAAGGRQPSAETDVEDDAVHAKCLQQVRYRAVMRGQDDRRQARPTAHELARYEALFAARTSGMKSSAMREMMALTERPDVISLAGGLPSCTRS